MAESDKKRLFFAGYYIIIRWRVDMELLFECSTRYPTSERRELVRYRVEHEKTNSISTSSHALFYLLYKHAPYVVSDKKMSTLLTNEKNKEFTTE